MSALKKTGKRVGVGGGTLFAWVVGKAHRRGSVEPKFKSLKSDPEREKKKCMEVS